MHPVLDDRKARGAIASLRDGVPPSASAAHFLTVGQARIRERLAGDLQKVAAGEYRYLFLVGEYGTGKSHFLRDLSAICLDSGYVVMSCAQDIASGASLNNPGRFYRRLASSFTYPCGGSDEGSLESLAEEWAEVAQPAVSQMPKSLARAFRLYDRNLLPPAVRDSRYGARISISLVGYLLAREEERGDIAEAMLSVLAGSGTTNRELLALTDEVGLKRPKGNIGYAPDDYKTEYYVSVLGVIAGMATVAGKKGLVVLLDEMEALGELTRRDSKGKANRVLDALVVNTEALSHTYVVFAYTPTFVAALQQTETDWTVTDEVSWPSICHESEMVLEALTHDQQDELARRIARIHGVAYSWDAEAVLVEFLIPKLERSARELSPRQFVRFTIEFLDQAHQLLLSRR